MTDLPAPVIPKDAVLRRVRVSEQWQHDVSRIRNDTEAVDSKGGLARKVLSPDSAGVLLCTTALFPLPSPLAGEDREN
jgi:hypothetical protein